MSSYTSSLGLELITPGSQAGLWGNTTNNTFTLVDQAVTGVTPISFASASGSTYTLTDYNGAVDEARSAVLNITGTAIGANFVVVPNKQKTYLVRNNTGQDVTFQTAVPTATYTVGAGYSILIFCDGNNNVFTGIASPSVGTLSVAGGGTGTTTFLTGGFVKSAGGTNALTASTYVALGSEVSGTLSVSNGGTGVPLIAANSLVVGAGTSGFTSIAPGTTGQVLTSNGTNWVAQTPTGGVTSVSASAPLASSGGATPNISITGQVGVANGGTGVSTFGTGGFVKSPGGTSNLTYATYVSLSTDVSGTLGADRGGTGQASLTSNNLLVGNGTGSVSFIAPGAANYVLTSNGATWAPAALPSFVTGVNAGTGISVTGTTNPTITNTGVTSVNGQTGAVTVSAGTGTVTSVGLSVPTGFSVSNTPITTSGTIALSMAAGYAIPTTTSQTNWDSAYSQRLQWDGGSTNLTASTGRASLGLGTMAVEATTSYVPKTGGGFTGDVTSTTLFRAPAISCGSSSSASMNMGVSGSGSALNFYAPAVGNGYTSIFFNATSSALTNQAFAMAFNNFSGTTYAPYQFNGAGNATATNGSWIDGSDIRIKENIVPIDVGLDAIAAMNPVKYSFKRDKKDKADRIGLIAQELEAIVPDVVFTSDDPINGVEGMKSVAYTNLIPILIKAIQELKAEVDSLKAAK